MDPTLHAVLAVSMRWIHITSVVILIGGFVFAKVAVAPALATVASSDRAALGNRIVANFRTLLFTVLATIFGSGIYNYLSKASFPPHYHMLIGIKFLFVIYIFAHAFLYTTPEAEDGKRNRWLTGMIVAGLVIFAISAVLRWISLA